MKDARSVVFLGGWLLLGTLLLPLLGVGLGIRAGDLSAAWQHPLLADAVAVSVRTTLVSLLLVIGGGTPLAWWLAHSPNRWAPWVQTVVNLPVVLPPAVVGVGLLGALGRSGVAGPLLTSAGLQIPFTAAAVVLAQTVVSSPFYIQAATIAFRRVSPEILIVARTLGAGPVESIRRVALPLAAPGLLTGAALAWARAFGEFGATLLFAGNRPGSTQTLPLAIFTVLEQDIGSALAFSLVLLLCSAVSFVALRVLLPRALTGEAT